MTEKTDAVFQTIEEPRLRSWIGSLRDVSSCYSDTAARDGNMCDFPLIVAGQVSDASVRFRLDQNRSQASASFWLVAARGEPIGRDRIRCGIGVRHASSA